MPYKKPRSLEEQILSRLTVAKTKGLGARLTNEMVEHMLSLQSKFLESAEKVRERQKEQRKVKNLTRLRRKQKEWRAEHKALNRHMTNHMVREIQTLRDQGLSFRAIGAKMQVSENTAAFWCKSEEERNAIRRKYSKRKSEKYHGDPDFRERVLKYQHERYHNEKKYTGEANV